MNTVQSSVNSPPPISNLTSGKLAYFCQFAAMAGFMPFLTLYYDQLGLTASQIGLLVGVTPVVTFLAAPLWGALADATHQHRRMLIGAVLAALVMMVLFLRASQLAHLLPIVILFALVTAPIMPLIDNSVLVMLGEQRQRYGRIRLWGALGWGVIGGIGGFLVDWVGLRASFINYFIFMLMMLVLAFWLPVAQVRIGNRFWQGARSLFTNSQWNVLLITIFCSGVGSSITNSFLFLYLDTMGGSRTLMGLSLAVATVSEVVIFFYSELLLRRWKPQGLLLIALLAQVVRIFAYAIMPAPWLILPISLLHGLTFSALWTASVAYAGELAAPRGLMTTAQGLLGGVTMGLGGVVGALVGGLVYEQFGPRLLFGAVGFFVLCGFFFFLLMEFSARSRPTTVEKSLSNG
jgi:PPP family 3-phenylpropionic acid transporter